MVDIEIAIDASAKDFLIWLNPVRATSSYVGKLCFLSPIQSLDRKERSQMFLDPQYMVVLMIQMQSILWQNQASLRRRFPSTSAAAPSSSNGVPDHWLEERLLLASRRARALPGDEPDSSDDDALMYTP